MQLRKIFVAGNRACAFVTVPLAVSFILMGKSIIEVWVGARFISSYTVLIILLIPSALYMAQSTSTRILFGMSLHRVLAYVVLFEGIANVVLSVALVRPLGIVGDAIGTAIPLFCTSVFFLPRHLCRKLDIPIREFLVKAYAYPLILSIPMIGVMLLMQRSVYAHNYLQLAINLGAGFLAYGVGLSWYVLTREPFGIQLRTLIQRYLYDV